MKWLVFNSPEAVAKAVCHHLIKAADKAIADNSDFHLVLAGGSTPQRCYELLAEEDCDWGKWHLWYGDERCLPVDDTKRNSVMVSLALSGKVPIPTRQIHVIPAELGPECAAELYSAELKGIKIFDLVMLGMGEDGHTASLFPEQDYQDKRDVLAIFNAPKPPSHRVSLSYSSLGRSREILFIVTGSAKKSALERWQKGADLPVNRVKITGESSIFTDQNIERVL